MLLNNAQRTIAIGRLQGGHSAARVAQDFGVHVRTIQRLMVRYAQTNDVKDRPRSGRPRVTTPRQDNFIRTTALRNRFKNATEINLVMQRVGNRRISHQTIRNRLHEQGIKARRPVIKPRLTVAHKAARLGWARAHSQWRLAQWNNVLFSDETRICLRSIDGRRRVWRRRGEQLNDNCVQEKTSFGGGSIMFWGGISSAGKTQLVRVNGNLNAQRYINDIIVPHVHPYAQRVGNNFVFQQDNARAHTARVVTNHFAQQGITVLPWPACSPDMNPIEHVWSQLKSAVYKRVDDNTTLAQLEQIALQEWGNLPQHRIRRLIRSMTSRVRECIQKIGSHTHY